MDFVDNTSTTPINIMEKPKEEGPLTFGAIQSGLVQNTIVGSVTNHAIDFGMNLFEEDDEKFKSNVGSKIEELRNMGLSRDRSMYVIENARNEQHYYKLMLEQQRQQENATALEKSGVAGQVFSIGAEIVDGIATLGGISKVAAGFTSKLVAQGTSAFESLGLSSKASELATKVVGGVGVEGAFEFSKQQTLDSNRTEMDYAFAFLGGAIGGAMAKTEKLNDIVTPIQKELNEALEVTPETSEIYQRTKYEQTMERLQFDYNKKFETSLSPTMRSLIEATEEKVPIFYNPRFKSVDNFSADEINRSYNESLNAKLYESFAKPWADYLTLKKRLYSYG